MTAVNLPYEGFLGRFTDAGEYIPPRSATFTTMSCWPELPEHQACEQLRRACDLLDEISERIEKHL